MEKLQRQLLQVVDRERQLKRKLEQRDKQQADSTVELRNSLQHARNQVKSDLCCAFCANSYLCVVLCRGGRKALGKERVKESKVPDAAGRV